MRTKAEKIRVTKTKEGRRKEGQGKKVRREIKYKEKPQKGENNESKKNDGGVEDLEWREESSKVRDKSQDIGFFKISQVDLCFQKESEWKNTNKENVEPYNRCKERICAEKRKGVFVVKKRKRKETQVHRRMIKERID